MEMEFADWLEAQMEAKGWSIQATAFYCGVSQPTVYNWLAGKDPKFKNLPQIFEAFGLEFPLPFVGSHSACSDEIVLDLREREPVLSLA